MSKSGSTVVLDEGLDLRQLVNSGSLLQINLDYHDTDNNEFDHVAKTIDFIGQPVLPFDQLKKKLTALDTDGLVKKNVLVEGGGMPPTEKNTVSIFYSGYWENEMEPFDIRSHKPLVVDLNDNGLLPGLQTAVQSMLVGEISVFFLSYKVMYGEMGIPPRIKPKADCIFYIQLAKSILTSADEELDLLEPNNFKRVQHEVKLLYSSGVTLHRTKNISGTIQLFRKAVFKLHKCRLADEKEEIEMEKLLVKLYTNLAICYNNVGQPLKACTVCNELRGLNKLWNNGKALLQNAKALRMIGEFKAAQKKLNRAAQLCPGKKEIEVELALLEKTRKTCDKSKAFAEKHVRPSLELVSEEFKQEVNDLIKAFKEDDNVRLLTLPANLNSKEVDYVKAACIRENLFCHKLQKKYALDKNESVIEESVIEENVIEESLIEENVEEIDSELK